MNYSKESIQNLFTLIVIAFLIIPLIYIIFKINPTPNEEGYVNYDNLADKNKKMDRVNINGVTINYGDGQIYVGQDNEHIYCPTGDVICPTGHSVQEESEYTLPSGNKAKSYKYMCKNDSTGEETEHVTCKNNYLSDASVNKITFISEGTDVDGTKIKRNFFDITSNSGNTKLTGTELNGFTDPYTAVPFEINGEYVYLYKDGNLDIKSNPCFLYEDSENCEKYLTPASSNSDTDVSSNSTGKCQHEHIKCLADNGSSVGDPLCCGQTGVLQDTKHNCPSEYPYCVGYKCGETWGKCTNNR